MALSSRCPCCYNKADVPENMKAWLTCFIQSGIDVFGDDWQPTGEPETRTLDDGSTVTSTPGQWTGFGQIAMAAWALGKGHEEYIYTNVIPCNKNSAWTATPDIERLLSKNISFQPSLDASNAGHWHGFVTNGECVP